MKLLKRGDSGGCPSLDKAIAMASVLPEYEIGAAITIKKGSREWPAKGSESAVRIIQMFRYPIWGITLNVE